MTRNKFTVLVLFTILLASLALWGQKPSEHDPATHVQHHIQFLTKQLGLTAAQQESATTIFTNAETSGKSIHEGLRDAHQSLQTAIQNNDVAAITTISNTIGNLTAQMVANQAKAEAAFYQVLTPEQQAKMKQFHEHGPGGPMFPGGHHGPPPQ